MTKGQKLFNTPIQIYSLFLENHLDVLQNVAAYACYDFCLTQKTSFDQAASYYSLAFIDSEKFKKLGEEQYNKYPINSPKVGIGLDTWRRFVTEPKEEFEKVCLLAFLGIKSVLGQKLFSIEVKSVLAEALELQDRNAISKNGSSFFMSVV